MAKRNIIATMFRFYYDGFRSFTWGRTLWLLFVIKLFVMFFILKLFFFPSFLGEKSEKQKQEFVGTELVNRVDL